MLKKYFFKYLFLRHTLCLLLLGFSSGLPFQLLGNSTLQAWYVDAGVDLKTIGWLSLIGIPYTWKFLWSPLLDRYVIPIFGKRRGWIALSQVLMAIVFVICIFQNPAQSPYVIVTLMLLLSFFSGSQDIAIGAYTTEVLKPDERGIGSAMVVSGFRIAMLVSGGLMIAVAGKIGWPVVYAFLAALMLLNIITAVYAPEPEGVVTPKTLRSAVILPFREFLSRKNAVMILVFIIIYKLGDNFAQALLTTFLMKGIGFSLVDIGTAYKITGFVATIIGVYIGGFAVLRVGLFRSLLVFAFFQLFSTMTFIWLNEVGKVYPVFITAIFTETFAAGLGTAAFLAFLMSLCNRQFTATQFAILSSLDAIGRTYVGPLAAWIKTDYGWNSLFIFSMFMAIPGIVVLLYLKRRRVFDYTPRGSFCGF